MTSARTATGLCGILALDKPSGLTSHDVVAMVRRTTGERRVGHAGTLDPMATGVLVVLVGPAARLAPYLSSATKRYEAAIEFGTQTTTDDAEGEALLTSDVPETLLDPEVAKTAVEGLVGEHDQVPPVFSAIKSEGRTAYSRARKGETVEMQPRQVTITHARLVGVRANPVTWDVEFEVSKGTYIRALARDLGRSLGTHAHLAALRRTCSGNLTLDDAVRPDALEAAGGDQAALTALFVDPVRALGLPIVDLDSETEQRVRIGSSFALAAQLETLDDAPLAVAVGTASEILAIYELQPIIPGELRQLKPLTVLATPVRRGPEATR